MEIASIPAQVAGMLSSAELLSLMAEKGIKKIAIAQQLDLDPARVTEMYKGQRTIKLDEAKALVEHFKLNSAPPAPVPALLSELAARLMVLYAANELGAPADPDDPRIAEVAADFQAFVQFATSPEARLTEEAVLAFFQALHLTRHRAS